MADLNSEYAKLEYNQYASDREFSNFFIDKKALPEVPVTGFQYIFFTAPELGITKARFDNQRGKGDSTAIMNTNGRLLKLPGYSESIYTADIVSMLAGESGTFMPLLTNRALNIPASAQVLDTLDYSETWNKHKIPIGTTTKDSKIAPNFEVRFRDDPNLTVIKTCKLWIDYIEGLFHGRIVSPYATATSLSDTQSAVIDYMSSAYTFSLRPDGKTLQYWAKYTGVFPTKIPYELFAVEDGEINALTNFSIDFQATYKEDMDITILRDFNLLGQSNKGLLIDVQGSYYDDNGVQLPTIGSYPGIAKVIDKTTNAITYELRLTDSKDLFGNTQNF